VKRISGEKDRLQCSFYLSAIPDAKPLRTFAGIALVRSKSKTMPLTSAGHDLA
jgi:hypothetical protein